MGLIPLFLITGAAVCGLFYAIIRSAMTRDDVRYRSSGKMICEEYDDKPRKFLVFNQKYETPKGLAEALAALEDPNEEAAKNAKKEK